MNKNVKLIIFALAVGLLILIISLSPMIKNFYSEKSGENNGTPAEVTDTKKEETTLSDGSGDSQDTSLVDTDSVTEPVTDDTTESVTDKVTEPVTEKVTEPVTDKVTEPVTDKVTEAVTEKGYLDRVEVVTEIPSAEHSEFLPNLEPAQITLLRPEASGDLTETNQYATIDYSNTRDGYVMVKYLEDTNSRIRVQISGPGTTYTYNLSIGDWEVFPLTDGSGDYKIKVYKNIVDNKYSLSLSLSCEVSLASEFAPFIRPNQYVNYEDASNTMNKAASLVAGKTELLDKVAVIYQYVVTTLSYDYDKAASVTSGYLPDLDAVLAAKKGICFDYAALMTGMLRSQNVPCKLVVGYANETYHAWISVWSSSTGWIDGAIYFDGVSWQRMDPTYASSGSTSIDKVQYTSKYFY